MHVFVADILIHVLSCSSWWFVIRNSSALNSDWVDEPDGKKLSPCWFLHTASHKLVQITP